MLKDNLERKYDDRRVSGKLIHSTTSQKECRTNVVPKNTKDKGYDKIVGDLNVLRNTYNIHDNRIKSNYKKKSIRSKISRLKSFFRRKGDLKSELKDIHENTNHVRLSKVSDFFKRLSIRKKHNRKNLCKVVFKSDNSDVSISNIDRRDVKTCIEFKLGSLLLNNIHIAEDVNIKAGSSETDNLKINTNNFIFRNSISINKDIMDVYNSHDNNSEVLDGVDETLPEIVSRSNIKSMESSVSSARYQLFKGLRSKSFHVEEYLKLKFRELEDSRVSLNKYLRNKGNEDNSIQLYEMNFKNKYDSNVRINNYMKLANKLSEVSFDCLLSNPNELSCQLVYNKDGLRVWKKEHNSGRVLLRTEFIVPISPLEYVEYVTDSNNRRVYDNNTVDLRTLEGISSGLDVMYVATKRIATVYPRDIVSIRFIHGFSIKDGFKVLNRDELIQSEIKENPENFICSSCTCSIEHPDAPERQGYVRMDLSIGSYMAIPIKTPFGIWSSISMFNEASPKGWIPSSVTKMIVAKMVPGSVENIISSMFMYYKLPYRSKINRPYSGFCNRILTTLYTDQKRLDTINFNNSEVITNQKTNKLYSKLSFLLNRPLLMSIQEFIALYKSNSLQEFIEHFDSTQIINRMMYHLKLSSTLNQLDLLSSSTDTSRNVSLELDNSKSIDGNINSTKLFQKQDPKFSTRNFSLEKISTDYCDYVQNRLYLRKMESSEKSAGLTFENSCSYESLESHRIINKEDLKRNPIQKSEHINSKNSRLHKLSIVFGASQIFDIGDLEILTSIFSLD